MAAMCVSPVMPGQKLPINVDTDLTPIANIAGVYNMLVFGKHVPFRTVPEMIDYAKKNPGKLTYASAGNGTSQHLAGELFKKMAGVNILHVPYRGGAPAIQDIVAGNCDMMFGNMPEFLGQIGGGEPDPDRLRLAAAVAAVSQPAADLAVPAGLRGGELVRRLRPEGTAGRPDRLWNKALRAAVAKPDVQKRFLENGMDTVIGSPAELEGHHRRRPQEVGGGHPGSRHARRLRHRRSPCHRLSRARRAALRHRRSGRALADAARRRSCSITASAPAPSIWAGWLPALADRYRLVTFDMRGYGRSHIPAADFRLVARPAGRRPVRRRRCRRPADASISWANRSAARWRWPRRWRGRSGSPRSPSATAPISARRSSASRRGGASSTRAA